MKVDQLFISIQTENLAIFSISYVIAKFLSLMHLSHTNGKNIIDYNEVENLSVFIQTSIRQYSRKSDRGKATKQTKRLKLHRSESLRRFHRDATLLNEYSRRLFVVQNALPISYTQVMAFPQFHFVVCL